MDRAENIVATSADNFYLLKKNGELTVDGNKVIYNPDDFYFSNSISSDFVDDAETANKFLDADSEANWDDKATTHFDWDITSTTSKGYIKNKADFDYPVDDVQCKAIGASDYTSIVDTDTVANLDLYNSITSQKMLLKSDVKTINTKVITDGTAVDAFKLPLIKLSSPTTDSSVASTKLGVVTVSSKPTSPKNGYIYFYTD